jgi:hypothetical protein
VDDHTVRINEDTLEDLKVLKTKWSLSYNDIIGMGLKLLREKDTLDKKTHINTDSHVYKIQVSLNRVRINSNVKNLLKSGYDLFIPDITPRQAMYIKRKLKSMGYEMNHTKSEGDGKIGFLFTKAPENDSEEEPLTIMSPDVLKKTKPHATEA